MSHSFFYTIVPARRLLWLTAALIPLAAAVSFLGPSVIAGTVAAALLTVAIDAGRTRNLCRGIRVFLPEIVRFSKDREGQIPVRIHSETGAPKRIRMGIPFPATMMTESEQSIRLPEDSPDCMLSWNCTPQSRGRFQLNDCFLEVASPLGLWNRRAVVPVSCEIRVYPNLLEDRKRLASLFLNRATYGMHARRMVGQGREFEKLREYVPGDSYDQLHWKATAKRRRPITKLYQMERTQEVYVVVDFSRLSAKQQGQETALEFYLRSTLILGQVAQRQGDLFGVLTFSDRVQGFLRAGNGKAHYSACRDLLYGLEPQLVTPDYEDFFSFVRLRLRRRALLVVLTDLSDPLHAESFKHAAQMVARQHLMIVSMIRPAGIQPLFQDQAETVDSLYEHLAGHMVWQNLQDLKNGLKLYGVEFHLLSNSSLTVDLVGRYLSVKQRQLL